MAGPIGSKDSGSIPEDTVSESSSKHSLSPLDKKVDSVSRETVNLASNIKTETPLQGRVKSGSSSIRGLFSESMRRVRSSCARLQKLFQKAPNKRGDNFVMVSGPDLELTEDSGSLHSMLGEPNADANKDVSESSDSGDSAEEETSFNTPKGKTGRNHIYEPVPNLEQGNDELLQESSGDVANPSEDSDDPLSPEAQKEADLLLASLQLKGSAPIQEGCCCSKACRNMLKVLSDLVSSISKLFRKLIAWIRGLIHRGSYDLVPSTGFTRRNAKRWKNPPAAVTGYARHKDESWDPTVRGKSVPEQAGASKEEELQKCLEELVSTEQGISDLSMKLSSVVNQTEDVSHSPDVATGVSSDALDREISVQLRKLQGVLRSLRGQLTQLRAMELSSVVSGTETSD